MNNILQEALRIQHLGFAGKAGNFYNINLEAYTGEMHGLMMPNTQFRSPFLDLLKGYTVPDEGEIYVDNVRVEGAARRRLLNQSVYTIELKSSLIDSLSLAENLFLVDHKQPLFLPERKGNIYKSAEKIFHLFGLEEPFVSYRYPRQLTPAQKTIMELLRAYVREPKVIYMENVTAVYSREEMEVWRRILKQLVRAEKSAVLLAFGEIFPDFGDLLDRLTVIRSGTTVMQFSEKPFLILSQPGTAEQSEETLRVRALPGEGSLVLSHVSNGSRLRNISFCIGHGETVGIFSPNVFEGQELMDLLLSKTFCTGSVKTRGKTYHLLRQKMPKLRAGSIPYGMDMLFYNRSLFQNVILRMPEKIRKAGIRARKRIVNFSYSNVMKTIHGRDLLEEYGKLERLPEGRVTKEQSIRIQAAKWLFAQMEFILMFSPESCYDTRNLHRLLQLLEDIHSQGVSVVIFSENLDFLKRCSSRILEVQDGIMWEYI